MATVSDVREQLVEAGMRVLERDGLPALSARKLAAETGTSTMAVYTHFGGMTGRRSTPSPARRSSGSPGR